MSDEQRYTIHLSIVPVDDEGETGDREINGVTLDYASIDIENLEFVMSYVFGIANEYYELNHAHRGNVNITLRRPQEEKETHV